MAKAKAKTSGRKLTLMCGREDVEAVEAITVWIASLAYPIGTLQREARAEAIRALAKLSGLTRAENLEREGA